MQPLKYSYISIYQARGPLVAGDPVPKGTILIARIRLTLTKKCPFYLFVPLECGPSGTPCQLHVFGLQPFQGGKVGAGCQQGTHQFCMKSGGLFFPLPLLLARAGVFERVSYLAVSRVSCDWTADDHHHSDVACVGVRGWGGWSTEVWATHRFLLRTLNDLLFNISAAYLTEENLMKSSHKIN